MVQGTVQRGAGEGEVICAERFPGKSSSVGNFTWKLKPFFGQQFKSKAQKTMNVAPD